MNNCAQIRDYHLAEKSNNHSKRASNTYFCGCHFSLASRQDFKKHVIQVHSGVFINGSSHYLSIITQIVLPVRNWNPEWAQKHKPQLYAEVKQEISRLDSVKEAVDERTKTRKTRNKTLNINNSGKRSPSKTKSQSYLQQNSMDSSQDIKTQKKLRKEKTAIEWNGFLLIPNTNQLKYKFFCGKCNQQFLTVQTFAMHCFEQCEELQHPLSSHRIEMEKFQQKIQQQIQQQIQEQTQQQNLHQQHIQKSNDNSRRIRAQAQKIRFQGLLHTNFKQTIFNRQSMAEASLLLFVCGCGNYAQQKSSGRYFTHIKRNHSQIIPQNSSHIVLRQYVQSSQTQRFNNYKLSVNTKNSDMKWYCPCEPGRFMETQRFIKHIMIRHKGMSPVYY